MALNFTMTKDGTGSCGVVLPTGARLQCVVVENIVEFFTITPNLHAILLMRWFVYRLLSNGFLTFKRLLISDTFSCPAAISHRVKYPVSSGML